MASGSEAQGLNAAASGVCLRLPPAATLALECASFKSPWREGREKSDVKDNLSDQNALSTWDHLLLGWVYITVQRSTKLGIQNNPSMVLLPNSKLDLRGCLYHGARSDPNHMVFFSWSNF